MRKILACFLVLLSFCAEAQIVYNNEWIDHSKTYYRFRVGKDGVHRISGATLATAGLGTATAQDFQLWRNGVQVPIYTSVSTGALSSGDYIEFWGQMNDGKPDKELYREAKFHLNDKWSLISDSATYFLTVNSSSANLRLQAAANDIAGNTLPAEPFFMHTVGHFFREKINNGLFYIVGTDHLFSSSYDQGEGWTSADIPRNGTLTVNALGNLYASPTGPAPTIKASVSGNAYNSRRYKISINGDSVLGSPVPYMNQAEDQAIFNLSLLNSGSTSIAINNVTDDCGQSTCPVDRMVAHKVEITYPRLFNFGGATNFQFSLPANATGNYLEISGFTPGGVEPVLYDLTNGKRYVTEVSGAVVRVVLQPSAVARQLVLAGQSASSVTSINTLKSRNFTNYSLAANQADYLIISHPSLFIGSDGSNPVEDYRVYRSTSVGGNYNAKVFVEEELIDQFGFGIKKNPAGIRNFIRFARNKFSTRPKHAFIIGRGMHYLGQRLTELNGVASQKVNLEKLNLVPSFGWPASDLLLSAEPGTSTPATPIGRLTAITPQEVSDYLKKVKDLELAQRTLSPAIGDRGWMKNIAHIAGAGEEPLSSLLVGYLNSYKRIIEDTLYGAKVTTFTKTSTNLVQQLNDADLTNLFNEGISLVTYYGHSSATTLEFNLDDPSNYNNKGKYPMFLALGCNAGNTFDYNENRFTTRNYLSDKYVLAPERGSINFIASSHFGIVHYLDIWNSRAYTNITRHQYGSTIGEVMKKTIEDVYGFTTSDDFFARCNAEETILNGDPAVRFNQQLKPDYTITDTMVRVSPAFVSVADQSFKVKASIFNLGKAISKKIVVEVKRELPDQTVQVLLRDTIDGVKYIDSVTLTVPIDPITDKGTNKIIVTVDADNAVDEAFETNNTTTKEIVIFEDEARPISPNPFAIVNQSNITLKASTANPFSTSKQYVMEIDTTERFNSSLKKSSTITATGGLLEFTPGIVFSNGTVYYWRVASVPSNNVYKWNTSSFVYLSNSEVGFNQSHYFQHLKSEGSRVYLDSATRTWTPHPVSNSLLIKNGVWSIAAFQEADLIVSVNGVAFIRNTCNYGIIINVFDKNTFKPWKNEVVGGEGLYQSLPPNCGLSRTYNFEFNNDTAGRRKAMEFLRNVVPNGNYVVVRNQPRPNASQNQYVAQWQADESIYGMNNSLYRELKNNGVTVIDSFYRLRTFGAVYKKGISEFNVAQQSSASEFDIMTFTANCLSSDSLSFVTSPAFGPAKQWKEARWSGVGDAQDDIKIALLGMKTNGQIDTLYKNIDASLGLFDVSGVNASVYPYMHMHLRNSDNVNFTPYQLNSWRLTYVPVPEGAIAPNLVFSMKDTVEVGEPLEMKIGFKNITTNAFADSLLIKAIVTDRNNSQHVLAVKKHKPVAADELLTVQFTIDTRNLVGLNTLFLDINPDNNQPEQFHYNNFAFRNFYVKGDTLNPLIDVTFDNVHILNRDIVSSKPNILIQLKDEAKWMLLNDPSVANIQVRYPDASGSLSSNSVTKTFSFNSDTLKFNPATSAPNGNNAASIEFSPYFEQDGEYELIVTGKDMSNNSAGTMSYKVAFQVINKAMISNMLNYPNPFTTSTAFVFTLTGAEVPQNLKIQILTVTGKIVREITKAELGPLHIGRNITEFKWDGTDQYGQKLANGVYLYRVSTNLNGKSLEKYVGPEENSEKYFNKGYGKMYLMR